MLRQFSKVRRTLFDNNQYGYQNCNILVTRKYAEFNVREIKADAGRTNQLQYDLQQLREAFPKVLNSLKNSKQYSLLPDQESRFEQMMSYNLLGSGLFRPMIFVSTYRIFADNQPEMKQNMPLVYMLAWITDMFQTSTLIIDDILDGSDERRGKPSWYKTEGNSLLAVYDGIVVYLSIFELLRENIRSEPYYLPIMEVVENVYLKTIMAQIFDVIMSRSFDKNGFRDFTIDRYNMLTINKTSYYTFYLPVAVALHTVNQYNKLTEDVKDILISLGPYLQSKDDYNDCFKGSELLDSPGSDIENGTCSWLIITALQYATDSQKRLLQENYGHADPNKINIVRQIYCDIGLPRLHEEYSKRFLSSIDEKIKKLSSDQWARTFESIINYKRI